MSIHATHIARPVTVSRVMLKVLAALLPGIAVSAYCFGPGVLVQLLLATVTALAAEAAVLQLRHRPVAPALADLSAVVTAWLLALSMPPLASIITLTAMMSAVTCVISTRWMFCARRRTTKNCSAANTE